MDLLPSYCTIVICNKSSPLTALSRLWLVYNNVFPTVYKDETHFNVTVLFFKLYMCSGQDPCKHTCFSFTTLSSVHRSYRGGLGRGRALWSLQHEDKDRHTDIVTPASISRLMRTTTDLSAAAAAAARAQVYQCNWIMVFLLAKQKGLGT